MNESRFRQLLELYITDRINTGDRQEFFRLLEQDAYRRLLEDIMRQEWDYNEYEETGDPHIAQSVEDFVMNRIKTAAPVKRLSFFRRYRVAAAAAILVFLSATFFLFIYKPGEKQELAGTSSKSTQDIPPGRFKAKLTIADGSSIVLDSAAQGALVKQGNTQVYNRNGQLVYDSALDRQNAAIIYNTLTTARGEIYSTVLADGSVVWLNAASSIKFPVPFNAKERKVEITGEAYFEIAPKYSESGKERIPFIVKAGSQEIAVLGTHFNINSYTDEGLVRTTLLEGSVRVSNGSQSVVLKPGQQSIFQNSFMVQEVNAEDAIAWKNGFFFYRHANIREVTRQLAKWYDVEVVYEGVDPQQTFTGKIDRNLPLSEVLKVLEQTKVHFRIEGKKLIILP